MCCVCGRLELTDRQSTCFVGLSLYSFVNPVFANSYHHHLIRELFSNIFMEQYGFHKLKYVFSQGMRKLCTSKMKGRLSIGQLAAAM